MKFYRCPICGNVIAKIKDSGAPVSCCGKPMEELVPNTGDGAGEKHVPVYSREGGEVVVRVGSVDHPMLDVHYIEWVVIQTKAGNQRKELKPGDAPVVRFLVKEDDEVLAVFAYCNLHGLYKA